MKSHCIRYPSAWPRPALLLVVLLAGWCSLPLAHGQANPNPPERLTFQGYLTDGNGNALGNTAPKNYDVIFRIWNSDSSTAAADRLWTEQQTVTVDKGYFSVLLGEGSSIGESRPALSTAISGPDASDRYVGITVKGIGPNGTDSDILPRLRLLSSPYAFLAAKAVTAMAVDGTAVSSGTVPDARLSSNVALRNGGNTLNGNQVVNGAVRVSGANVLEVGADVAGKNAAAGTIGYQTYTAGALDIVGAGTDANTRKVKIWAEGEATFTGPVQTPSTVTASAFVGDGTIPIGGIIMWSGAIADIPSGWALCNGNPANGRATPDLRDRFVVGAGNSYAVGNAGGSSSITLNNGNLPNHAHTFKDAYHAENQNPPLSGGWNTYPPGGGADWYGNNRFVGSSGTDSDNNYIWWRPMTTDPAGGNQPFDNRPPYYALAYIMRVR